MKTIKNTILNYLNIFFNSESKSGITMILAAFIAMIIANSKYYHLYAYLISKEISITILSISLKQNLHHFVNEFLMSLFFMMIGLEIKCELIDGNLSDKNQIILPLIATIMGVIVPSVIFIIFNYNEITIKAWAIPIVTDIAFAICILSFFKNNILNYLKIFILSLAVFDDLIGIIVIAIFYSKHISYFYLILSSILILILYLCNNKNMDKLVIYALIGVFLWYILLKSGIHPTISGVITAFFIPYKDKSGRDILKMIISKIHPYVSYIIIPIFAFCNSGINLSEISWESMTAPISIGILLGLFIGKQLGVFLSSYLLIKYKIIKLNINIPMIQLYGVSILTGIGFTVSFFIEELVDIDQNMHNSAKIAILIASLSSAIFGSVILKIQALLNKNKPLEYKILD